MQPMKVLVIEDDQATANTLIEGIKAHGSDAHAEFDGEAGYRMAASGQYDVIVTDWMMPTMDGLSMIKCLREDGVTTPVLMLSAKDNVDDLVSSLDAGCDDYLTKPYALTELMARLRVLTKRRDPNMNSDVITLGDITLDKIRHEATRDGNTVYLNPREFRLLNYMMMHPNEALTKTMLLKNVWEYDFDPQTNVVEVHISRLRTKLDKGHEHQTIQTVRGVGYVFSAE